MDCWLDHEEPPITVDNDSYDGFDAYSTSMYWSVVTLFTTGYGDITAYNNREHWTAIVVIVVGSILTAYLIGTLTSLAFESDADAMYLQQKSDEAYAFGDFYGL